MVNSIRDKTKNFISRSSAIDRPGYFLEEAWLALAVYLIVAWFILPLQAFWSPDEGAKLLQLQYLRWENGRPAYDIEYTGRDLDPQFQFASGGILFEAGGRLYLHRFPLFPLLSLPFFRWFGWSGLYVIPAVAGAAVSILTLQLLQRPYRRRAMWVLVAFGSPVTIYASMFWEHTLASALCLGAAWLSFYLGPVGWAGSFRRIAGWIIIGLLFAVSIYLRTETILFALAWLAGYGLLAKEGRWGVIWAGAALGIMLLLYVPLHRAMFGETENILHNSFIYGFHPLTYLERAGWQIIPDFLIGAAEDEAIAVGWLGWLWAMAVVIVIGVSLISPSRLAHKFVLLGLGISVLAGATFLFNPLAYRSAHGLLFTTPWAALGLCRAREVWQAGDWRARVIVLSTGLGLISYFLMLSVIRAPMFGPHGALEWGARYVMTFYPLLAIMAAWTLKEKWQNLSSLVIIGGLVFLGIGFQIRGLGTIRHDRQINAALNEIIAAAPSRHVVSDLWWLSLNTSPFDPQKTIFFTPPEKLADWVDLASANQVQQFILVTLNPALLQEASQKWGLRPLDVLEVHHLENLLILHVAVEDK